MSKLKWLRKDYYRVESTRMYPPLPFQYILTFSRKLLTRKWIRQMLPCCPHHIGAPVWNPVGYSMVSLCGSFSRPDRYQSFVASESWQALFSILLLTFCYTPYPNTRDLYLSRSSIFRWLGLSLPYQMWNISKKDPRISMLLRVEALQWALIWGRQCHHMSLEISVFFDVPNCPHKVARSDRWFWVKSV